MATKYTWRPVHASLTLDILKAVMGSLKKTKTYASQTPRCQTCEANLDDHNI